MTTEAPQQTFDHVTGAAPLEHETAPLAAPASDGIIDCFQLLDHRGRRRAVTPRLARRGPYLALQDGDQTHLVPLEPKLTHIGRSVGSDVRFEDPRVSRSHAILVRHGRYVRVLDNRSSHGTFLNDRRIVATNLTAGDVLRVGPAVMQFVEIS